MNSFTKKTIITPLKTLLLVLAACVGLSSAKADEVQYYTGQHGGVCVELVMLWDESGRICGEMNYGGNLITLVGSNPRTGYIRFTDSDGDVYSLTKRLTSDRIIWSGTMNNSVPVAFSRPR